MSRPLLITGATGKQGGAVINALLAANGEFDILAVTRDTSSSSAQKLAAKSPKIKLVQGNLDEPEALFKNAESLVNTPIWGVFSVQVPPAAKEETQGKALIDTALKHSVSHFVYTSVDRGGSKSFENPTSIPHFISKHNIEQYLVASTKDKNMSWTILQPTAFMDNFGNNFFAKIFATTWKVYLKDKPLQVVATSDIGVFAAKSFMDPEAYKSKSLPLAGSELTYEQANAIFKEKTGNELPTTFAFLSYLLLRLVKDVGYMFKWFRDEGYGADIAELKKLHPGLLDLGTWLETESTYKTKK